MTNKLTEKLVVLNQKLVSKNLEIINMIANQERVKLSTIKLPSDVRDYLKDIDAYYERIELLQKEAEALRLQRHELALISKLKLVEKYNRAISAYKMLRASKFTRVERKKLNRLLVEDGFTEIQEYDKTYGLFFKEIVALAGLINEVQASIDTNLNPKV